MDFHQAGDFISRATQFQKTPLINKPRLMPWIKTCQPFPYRFERTRCTYELGLVQLSFRFDFDEIENSKNYRSHRIHNLMKLPRLTVFSDRLVDSLANHLTSTRLIPPPGTLTKEAYTRWSWRVYHSFSKDGYSKRHIKTLLLSVVHVQFVSLSRDCHCCEITI